MKLVKLSSAVGLACMAMASQTALALPASSWTSSNSANIYISGASAQDNGILTFALQECTNGSVHRYAISNNFVYFCTPSAALNVGSTQVAIHKFSVGGSGNGVAPVNSGAQLPFLDLSKIASLCAAAASNITTAATFGTLTQTYVNTVCGAASSALTTNAVTKIGLSDVEPAFFEPAANRSNLTSEALATLIFAVPVSRNIYKALQTQQGLNVGACTNTASSTAAPTWEYSNQCMPSLTRAQLVSAYTQAGQTWAGIGVTSGLTDDAIYVARRVDTSGTQKTFEALIARTPNGTNGLKSCVAGTDLFVAPDTGTTTGDVATACSTGPVSAVFSGSGGGDVRNCMIAHNAAGRGAIGILTSEDIASAATNWRFVKVNGAAPVHADVASGNYQFWTVPTLNYLAATAATAPYTNVLTRFKFEFADPVGLAIQQPFGPSGLMALWALQAGAPALNFTGSNSVNPWGRLVGGATLDNCQSGKAANF
jgi:hypothetical protein